MAATVRTSQRVTGGRPAEAAGAGDDTGQLSEKRFGGRDWVSVSGNGTRSNGRAYCWSSPLPSDRPAVTMSPSRFRLPAGRCPLHARSFPMRFSRLFLARPALRAPRAGRPRRRHRRLPQARELGRPHRPLEARPEGPDHRRRDEGRPEVQHLLLHQEEVRRLRDDVQGATPRRRRQQRRADPQHVLKDNKKFVVAARRWTSARATGAACTARASAG